MYNTVTQKIIKVFPLNPNKRKSYFYQYPSPLNYRGFPKSVCTSVNNCVCHGIPDDRPLADGDIVNVDVTVFLDGFHGDCSKTFLVGNVDARGRKLVEVKSLFFFTLKLGSIFVC
jgi:methionine aminopeptidase